jgi:hypothetical protein
MSRDAGEPKPACGRGSARHRGSRLLIPPAARPPAVSSEGGNLTDASTDLWKTLLIWSKRVARDIEAPFRTQ